MATKLVLSALLSCLAIAQFTDGTTFYKDNTNYGEQTYLSEKKLTHFNSKLGAYHELLSTDGGLILNWQLSQDVYGNKVPSNGTHNLRYGLELEAQADIIKASNRAGKGAKLRTPLTIFITVLIVVSIIITVSLFLVLRRIKKTD